MEENREEYYSLGEIINNIKTFFNYLLRKWWLLVIVTAAGAGLGVIYYYKQRPKYEAVTTFILEEKSASGGGLAGLASQFGFNIGGLSGGGSIFTGDNILEILRSKKVVQRVLLTQVDDTASKSPSLADLYIEFTGAKKKWQKKPLLADVSFIKTKELMSPIQDSILNIIYESIVKRSLVTERTSKQSTIIKVQVIAANCLFARLMSERLVYEASKLYLDIRVGTAEANINRMQRRSDSLLALLNNKSYSAASIQPIDVNPGLKTAIVPVEIASRDKSVIAALYTEVVKNLEGSKLLLSQQTPVIQVLDRPEKLMHDKKKGFLFLIIVFSMMISGAYIFYETLNYFNKTRKNRK